MIKKYEDFLNEDSLDDFDIGGKAAAKRAATPDQTKVEVDKLIDKTIAKIHKNCEIFFKQKGLNLKENKYAYANTYRIERPNLSWGFTYSPRDGINFLVIIGGYGHIEGIEKDESYTFLKEFADFIKSKIKFLHCNNDIWKDSLSGIYGSAPFIVRFGVELKDLK